MTEVLFFLSFQESRKGKTVPESKHRIGVFALKCMADLLISMPHFNFAKTSSMRSFPSLLTR